MDSYMRLIAVLIAGCRVVNLLRAEKIKEYDSQVAPFA